MNLQGENEKVKLEPLISEKEVSEATHAGPVTDSMVLTPQVARLMEGVQVMAWGTANRVKFLCCCGT